MGKENHTNPEESSPERATVNEVLTFSAFFLLSLPFKQKETFFFFPPSVNRLLTEAKYYSTSIASYYAS